MSTEEKEEEPLWLPALPTSGNLDEGVMSSIGIFGIQRSPVVNEEFDAYWRSLFGNDFVLLPTLLGLDDRELLKLSELAKLTADDSWVGQPCSVAKLSIAQALMTCVMRLGVSLPVASP